MIHKRCIEYPKNIVVPLPEVSSIHGERRAVLRVDPVLVGVVAFAITSYCMIPGAVQVPQPVPAFSSLSSSITVVPA
jgi:hypothetical protein